MRKSAFVLVSGPLFGGGVLSCTGDLPAPDEYVQADSGDESDDSDDEFAVDCGSPPAGAVGADYVHEIEVSGGTGGPYTFAASDLSPLDIDSVGRITGVPQDEGTLEAEITATDAGGAEAQTTCRITVNPGLAADIPTGKALPCVVPGESFGDFVADGTGDGTPLTCTLATGSGRGTLPAGISVDEDDCTIQGSVEEDRYGTWVWIVEASQHGATAYLPYCATQSGQAADAYDIMVDLDGTMAQNAALVPGRGTFRAGESIAFGDQMAPRFEITGDECAGGSCYFGWAFGAPSSPFDLAGTSFGPDDLLRDMNNSPYGFFHHFHVTGGAVDEALEGRPWALNVRLDYCLSGQDGPCDSPANVRANGKSRFNFAVVMFPE